MQFKFGYIYPHCNPHRLHSFALSGSHRHKTHTHTHPVSKPSTAERQQQTVRKNSKKWREKQLSKLLMMHTTDVFVRQCAVVQVFFVIRCCCSGNRRNAMPRTRYVVKCARRKYICVTASLSRCGMSRCAAVRDTPSLLSVLVRCALPPHSRHHSMQ